MLKSVFLLTDFVIGDLNANITQLMFCSLSVFVCPPFCQVPHAKYDHNNNIL